MELLSLSKFKLQLFALIFEARDLKEKEQRAREELHLLIQKQKQNEVELGRKFQEMQAELALCHEMQHNLENKVKYLENDNALQEKKQKELKGTIDSLLQSRETFVSRYEDSTCELKHSIETRDRKLAVLSEKLQTHFLLFDSIEKEAVAVKQVVDSVQCLVNEKEKVVAGLKKKMDKISTFEKDFFEKISFLENMLRNNQDELRRKDGIVWELKEQLKEAKVSCNLEPQIDELQKSLSMKEEIIQNLTAENQVLRFEIQSLGVILQKFQDTVITNLNTEVREKERGCEACARNSREENNRLEDMVQVDREASPFKNLGQGAVGDTALPLYQEYSLVSNPSCQKQNVEAYVSEASKYLMLFYCR
ncbi:uncharacterized protein LOC143860137 [Tasmannia lanceolata]|uniref:uncharacterized protein LOC143860137 n=1 Tax=Tasmannia lanceolata TaxID=3420 RepID=UPI00406479FA